MSFAIPTINYTGKIREVTIGSGASAVTVGGESCYPFYTFEGAMPHPPRVAFEVWDYAPEDWPAWAVEPYKDVIADPAAWAKKSVETYHAEMIALLLKSADPNGMNRAVEEVVATVKAVSDAVSVPLIVWGCANDEKDAAMLRRVAEVCEGKNVALGPVTEKNYKQIGAMAIGYNQVVIASTPIDVNLAKQLNILLGNLGVPDEPAPHRPHHGRPRLRSRILLFGDGARPHGRPHPGGREAPDADHLQPRERGVEDERGEDEERGQPEARRREEEGRPHGIGRRHDACHGRRRHTHHETP